MRDFQISEDTAVNLKQKLLEALRQETLKSGVLDTAAFISKATSEPSQGTHQNGQLLSEQESAYRLLMGDTQKKPDSSAPAQASPSQQGKNNIKSDFDGTLSLRGVVPVAATQPLPPTAPSLAASQVEQAKAAQAKSVKSKSVISGGSMADLSGYKDLSKAPLSFGDEETPLSSLAPEAPSFERSHFTPPQQSYSHDLPTQEVDTEFSGNVKTLIRLVNELPEGVTKQTGAQIIRLTMEAMGISMEDVLSEAQSAQSEMLDAVRANIKKIEEYKTVIRKLETDIKYYQGKANELSEIIDLFILSNTTGGKMQD